ncbi:hypothetical protein COCMIDRAFT_102510 [Bipolaris oryzae ATCC 44560]|uniref:Phosphatidylglycerol/phosphatidylinositol transfer protein n=1 Tax=Bipolaris oryzae ATCC 44560 TaxID=930090 RepID=W6Z5I8_COCMI|nr:uncharacterized protein COCMIDRAFT_102510 [Bipolaris oryzae ATCC 44560]EUC42829.1 hypothetical protein COCMIDRAFT_102510 [Bipolaris oryzae ATCC 44560]
MFSKTTLLMALNAGLTLAGNAILTNRCSYDIWVSSVGGTHQTPCTLVPARTQYTEVLYNTGTSLKISSTDSIKNGEHTQFEYSIAGGKIWYDISFVNCAEGDSASACPGHAEGLAMRGTDDQCSAADCAAGDYCPTQAYYVDTPLIKLGLKEPVFDCPTADVDLHMTVCSGEDSLKRSVAGRVAIDLEG